MTSLPVDLTSLEPLLGPAGKDVSDPATLAALRDAVSQAAAQNQTEALERHVRLLPREAGIHLARTYLEAALAILAGDTASADHSFHSVCEKLNQSEAWPMLAEIALEWLDGSANPIAARYLVRAWKNGGTAAVSEAALRRAHEIFPDDHEVSWCLGWSIEQSAAGSTREAGRLVASPRKP